MEHLCNLQRNKREARRSTRGGQATVEFALIFLVLILLLFGILETGRLMFINSGIENAAREGARYAALNARIVRDDPTLVRPSVLSKLVLVDESQVTINVQMNNLCDFCPVTVEVTYPWTTVVPILSFGSLELHSTSTKLIENSR